MQFLSNHEASRNLWAGFEKEIIFFWTKKRTAAAPYVQQNARDSCDLVMQPM